MMHPRVPGRCHPAQRSHRRWTQEFENSAIHRPWVSCSQIGVAVDFSDGSVAEHVPDIGHVPRTRRRIRRTAMPRPADLLMTA